MPVAGSVALMFPGRICRRLVVVFFLVELLWWETVAEESCTAGISKNKLVGGALDLGAPSSRHGCGKKSGAWGSSALREDLYPLYFRFFFVKVED